MVKMQIAKQVKYKSTVIPSMTVFEVDDKDVEEIKKAGGFIVEGKPVAPALESETTNEAPTDPEPEVADEESEEVESEDAEVEEKAAKKKKGKK